MKSSEQRTYSRDGGDIKEQPVWFEFYPIIVPLVGYAAHLVTPILFVQERAQISFDLPRDAPKGRYFVHVQRTGATGSTIGGLISILYRNGVIILALGPAITTIVGKEGGVYIGWDILDVV